MLKTRVITAVFLLAALVPSLLYLSQRHWALLMAAVAGLAAWEWGGLLLWRQAPRVAFGALVALVATVVTVGMPAAVEGGLPPAALPLYLLAAAFWCLLVPIWLARKWQPSAALGGLAGLVVIVPAWLAIVQLRSLGPAVLLAILAVAWIADIAAYFAGKAFGRHKLAPAISPGKTWEGAAGAAAAVLAYGTALGVAHGPAAVSLPAWMAALLLVTGVSILGDLFESLLKRQAGLKDSSAILPGHGGILDRIDSLTSTLPTVACLWLLFAGERG